MFNVLFPQVVFQEVPDEVSLAYTVTGCPLACPGCHTPECQDKEQGQELTTQVFQQQLERYQGLISCVLFMGGEWYVSHLSHLLQIAQSEGLKTCLYSGMDNIPQRLLRHLTYVKTGPWLADRGGLDKVTTNQKFIHLASGNLLNYKFREKQNVATKS